MNSSDQTETAKLLSPCVSICQIDPKDGNCRGCHRTRSEIAAWGNMSQDEQLRLLEVLRQRRARTTGIRLRPTRRSTNLSKI